MELSTIIGIVVAVGALLGGLVMGGGALGKIFDPASLVIVFGGTLGAALISSPLTAVVGLPKLFAQSIQAYSVEPREIIEQLVALADQARREGILALEERARSIEDEFIRKGIMLVVDGVDSDTVRDVLSMDLDAMTNRHETGIGVLERMGTFSPAMGLIGTVMGLVNAMGSMNDPDSLGSAVAVAFLTTLWGAFAANVLWLPTAGKLRGKHEQEHRIRRLAIEGILAIQAGQSPRIVREKLESFLSPADRGGAAEGEAA